MTNGVCRRTALVVASATAMAGAAPVFARDVAQAPSSPVLSELFACLSLPEGGARLACYDTKVGALKKAQAQDDIVVMDRADVHRVRRSLFGLTLPAVDIFGGHAKPDKGGSGEDVDRITDTVTSAVQGQYGKWTIVLGDGTRWTQIDDISLNVDPRPGMPVVIRRAAMGSYLANIDGQTAIRVHRVN